MNNYYSVSGIYTKTYLVVSVLKPLQSRRYFSALGFIFRKKNFFFRNPKILGVLGIKKRKRVIFSLARANKISRILLVEEKIRILSMILVSLKKRTYMNKDMYVHMQTTFLTGHGRNYQNEHKYQPDRGVLFFIYTIVYWLKF